MKAGKRATLDENRKLMQLQIKAGNKAFADENRKIMELQMKAGNNATMGAAPSTLFHMYAQPVITIILSFGSIVYIPI